MAQHLSARLCVDNFRAIAEMTATKVCSETRSGESIGVFFENRRGACLKHVSTGSAEKRAEWPPE